jgi:putative Holliday junction resolvase
VVTLDGSRILALDLGDRRIGVAISDELGMLARPLEVIDRRKSDAIARVCELTKKHGVRSIVVGLPLNMDGTEGRQAKQCREFVAVLEQRMTGLAIVWWDERLTTRAAHNLTLETRSKKQRRNESLDATSACFILQGYLDSQKASQTKQGRGGESSG